jgi:HEAT repeat protein
VHHPALVPALVKALENKDETVRYFAATGLHPRLFGLPPAETEELVKAEVDAGAPEALAKVIERDVDRLLRIPRFSDKDLATKALRELAPERVTPALVTALQSRNDNLRIWLCIQLGEQKDGEAAEAVRKVAAGDPVAGVRTMAQTILRRQK